MTFLQLVMYKLLLFFIIIIINVKIKVMSSAEMPPGQC